MTIVNHDSWQLSEKGIRDSARHREKVDEQIRKNVKNVIGESSIITKKGDKKVRIPIKGLKDFQFRHGFGDGAQRGGIGQGKGKPGDVVGRQPGDSQDGKAGNEKGDEYMEVEVDIDYLIKIMFEELGLPYLEEKTKMENVVPTGYKFTSISKIGIPPRLNKKRSVMESLKRTSAYIGEIMDITGCTMPMAETALAQAQGDLDEAIIIIKENRLDLSIDPSSIYMEEDDLRYKQIEQTFEPHSNAVVIAMMDISGSMTPDKKYLCKSFLFWLCEFLKKGYDNVQIRFIVHTTDARLVDEDAFFKKGEMGGTLCHTAFDLANHVLSTEFPYDDWNRYVIYAGDGEDFDTKKTIESAKTMVKEGVNMLSYIEVQPASDFPYYSSADNGLSTVFRKEFDMKAITVDGKTFFKNDDKHIITCEIKGNDYIYPALKATLFDRKK